MERTFTGVNKHVSC